MCTVLYGEDGLSINHPADTLSQGIPNSNFKLRRANPQPNGVMSDNSGWDYDWVRCVHQGANI